MNVCMCVCVCKKRNWQETRHVEIDWLNDWLYVLRVCVCVCFIHEIIPRKDSFDDGRVRIIILELETAAAKFEANSLSLSLSLAPYSHLVCPIGWQQYAISVFVTLPSPVRKTTTAATTVRWLQQLLPQIALNDHMVTLALFSFLQLLLLQLLVLS